MKTYSRKNIGTNIKVIFILLLLFTLCACQSNKKQDDPSSNKDYITVSDKTLIEKRTIDNLIIDDIMITYDGKAFMYKATITSTADNNYVDSIEINFYKDDDIIASLYAPVDSTLTNNGTYTIKTSSDKDLTGINKIEYEIIRNK